MLCCVVSCCVAGQVLWECAPFTQLSGVVSCCVAGQVLWECAPFTQLSCVVLCGRTSAVGVCPIHTAERCCVMLRCVAGQVLWECAPFTKLSGVMSCCVPRHFGSCCLLRFCRKFGLNLASHHNPLRNEV